MLKTETNTYRDGIARTVSYTYDPDGRRATLTYPNNAYTFNYTYTGRSQLNTIVNNATSQAVVNYDCDRNGNIYTRALDNGTSSSYG